MRSRLAWLLAWLAVSANAPAFAAEFKYPWQGGVVYGRDLLSREERKAYWRELNALATDAEKEAYWRAHIAKMQEIARRRGVSIEDPPRIKDKPNPKTWWRDPYFSEIMTREEVAAYRRDLDAMATTAEHDAYRAAHIRRMQERARRRGIGMLSTEDWEPILRADAARRAAAGEASEEVSNEVTANETAAAPAAGASADAAPQPAVGR